MTLFFKVVEGDAFSHLGLPRVFQLKHWGEIQQGITIRNLSSKWALDVRIKLGISHVQYPVVFFRSCSFTGMVSPCVCLMISVYMWLCMDRNGVKDQALFSIVGECVLVTQILSCSQLPRSTFSNSGNKKATHRSNFAFHLGNNS